MDTQEFGAYTIQQRLRKDDCVEVYAAFDSALARAVTLRVFHQRPAASDESVQQHLQQITSQLAALRHPYIARTYASGTLPERLFWVVEHVGAITLADRLAQRRQQSNAIAPADIARLLQLVAQALDYAHGRDVIHGNLSPASVYLTDLDEPVLTDFGVAALLGAGWASTQHVAPEQAAGEPAGPHSDIYALGVILHQLITGRVPQPGDHLGLGSVEQVVQRALCPTPAERFATAGELAAAYALAVSPAGPASNAAGVTGSLPHMIGRFQNLQALGKRGNLIVYRADDPKLERTVAIKVLHPDLIADDQLRSRFRNEIELIAALEHHAIVQVYDFGLHNGQPFVVMPLLEGGTLTARLQAAPISPQQFVPILARVAEALDDIHARGIVHRQVTPSNILFDQQGKAYLSDIAIAAISESSLPLADQGDVDEVAFYMSPEQARARTEGGDVAIDRRSDIYALGAILFEVISGQVPYRATTSYQTAMQHLTAPTPSLATTNADLIRAYQPIIDRAMAKNPAERYPAAGLLARDFREAASGRWYLRELSDIDTEPPSEASGAGPGPIAAVPPQLGALARQIGRYHVERELGRGGMAVVYLGYDSHIKRRVAIKILPAQFMQIPLFQQRFHQEAELVARFHHPSIVGIYDFGEHDGQPFIVMQYLPKGTLANRLQHEALSLQQVSPIIERVAAALDEAHGHGIIHHDVKPANIIFNSNDQALLSDFGIAVLAEALATLSHNTHIGFTPTYVSPERVLAFQQQDFSAIDWRSDIYSLGVVVFEALAGQSPFHGATATATALAHVQEPIPRISAINPALPKAWQEIIDRALARRPADRYQSAGELAQDVKEMASSRWFLRKLLD